MRIHMYLVILLSFCWLVVYPNLWRKKNLGTRNRFSVFFRPWWPSCNSIKTFFWSLWWTNPACLSMCCGLKMFGGPFRPEKNTKIVGEFYHWILKFDVLIHHETNSIKPTGSLRPSSHSNLPPSGSRPVLLMFQNSGLFNPAMDGKKTNPINKSVG